jgi:hypothetical protein
MEYDRTVLKTEIENLREQLQFLLVNTTPEHPHMVLNMDEELASFCIDHGIAVTTVFSKDGQPLVVGNSGVLPVLKMKSEEENGSDNTRTE